VTQCVMKVTGYGGTGFLAKELVQDLLHTPLFEFWSSHHSRWVSSCVDLNSWCAVGPGARRGLNRLHGRRVNWNAYCDDDRVAHQFLRELRQVFGERDKYWHGSLEGRPVFQLELHDVQFQLCELDKYEEEAWPGATLSAEVQPRGRHCGAGSHGMLGAFGCAADRAAPGLKEHGEKWASNIEALLGGGRGSSRRHADRKEDQCCLRHLFR